MDLTFYMIMKALAYCCRPETETDTDTQYEIVHFYDNNR